MAKTAARILAIGLEEPEVEGLREQLPGVAVVGREAIPRVVLQRGGELRVERSSGAGSLSVDAVIFHGVFEDDMSLFGGLALWGGPCLPSAQALLDCRLRVPCLAKALEVTRFGGMARRWASAGSSLSVDAPVVAKWGNWHCGEDKARVEGMYCAEFDSLVEPFIEGEAVRVVQIGGRQWQVQLRGDDWKRSLHHPEADFMPLDPRLGEDAERLVARLGLEMAGIDYMVGRDGQAHLLEVNSIPNVTRFGALREAFLELAAGWVRGLSFA
jgi:hypothetical protein